MSIELRPWLAERLERAIHRAAGDLGKLGPEYAQARLGRLAHLDDLEADVLALPDLTYIVDVESIQNFAHLVLDKNVAKISNIMR